MTLRRLHIHLIYGYFIEYLIEHVPALEILSVTFRHSLASELSHRMEITKFKPTAFTWFDKVKKT
jgi:hypothetical protein